MAVALHGAFDGGDQQMNTHFTVQQCLQNWKKKSIVTKKNAFS